MTLIPYFMLTACKFKPTYHSSQVAADLKKMCTQDYKDEGGNAPGSGDNLQAFFWRVGLLKSGQLRAARQRAEGLERVLLCATRTV